MQTAHVSTSEVAIFSRVLEPEEATLSVAAAEAILGFGFKQRDKDRMAELSAKVKVGTLSPEEQEEINNYEKVGHVLSLMKSKAEGPEPDDRHEVALILHASSVDRPRLAAGRRSVRILPPVDSPNAGPGL
jgi:hypothetical protein